ncbi:gliding motility-associated C-terminal domain-containing protein [Owenweeksia hongkongensis]|uniref:gliding motility-associated C-terminal domain-containing protein n=1 Tax=Owenweeksia hongkongensis TaxID=253245 RepID=UPI003A947B76
MPITLGQALPITKLRGRGGRAAQSTLSVDSLSLERLTPSTSLITSTKDTSICQGDTLQLFINARNALSYQWDDNSTASLRAITQPGTYYVDAFYPCGDILSDTIVVTSKDTLITSRHDTSLCPRDTLWLSPNAFGALNYLWDNNSTDSVRYINAPGIYWVNSHFPCGRVMSDTVVVSAQDVLPPITVNDTIICQGETAHYKVPPGPAYTLDGNPVSTNFDISTAGQYTLTATNSCESDTFLFEVSYLQVPAIPNIEINDTALCEGEEMQILLPDSLSYVLNSIPVKQNPMTISERNDYELLVDNGCETRIFTFTIHDEGCETLLFVPNAFTPDGDGVNDCFDVSVIEQQSYHIMVFNRWGQMVFESTNPEDCWDGSHKAEIQAGVYTYRIIVQAPGRKIDESGIVQVVR